MRIKVSSMLTSLDIQLLEYNKSYQRKLCLRIQVYRQIYLMSQTKHRFHEAIIFKIESSALKDKCKVQIRQVQIGMHDRQSVMSICNVLYIHSSTVLHSFAT